MLTGLFKNEFDHNKKEENLESNGQENLLEIGSYAEFLQGKEWKDEKVCFNKYLQHIDKICQSWENSIGSRHTVNFVCIMYACDGHDTEMLYRG